MIFKAFLLLALLAVAKIGATPLDDYVNAPDAYFSYKLLKTYEKVGFKLYVLNVTSQKWMNESWVQNPVWWHFVSITVPDKLTRPDAAMLVIDGGGMNDDIPDETDSVVELTTILAVSTGAVVVDLKQTPNQPLVFLNDPTRSRRSEDNAISWTWKTFLENPDDPDNQKFILYLPMVKSVVKTMDAASDFLQKTEKLNINKYMVAGPSKRGWATWLTMAVDKRVFAAVPIVMDLLNLNTNLHNHFRSLGGWTFAFDRYHQNNVTKYIDSYSMFAMEKIIDPLNYLDRYKDIKTLAIVTGGDEFFLIDETQSYWDNVVSATGGSILLRRIPNAEHTCVGHEISLVLSIRSFFMTVYDGLKLPRISWLRANNRTHGILQATVDLAQGPRPYDVKVYYARTLDGKRKDFRLVVADPNDPDKKMAHPVIWESTSHVLNTKETPEAITYTAAFPKPIVGWLGFFIQFNFQSVDSSVIVATTETNVIPETYPFADCTLDSCLGTLV